MHTTYRFSEVRMTKKAMTFCTECKQSLSRTLSRSYYRNGFHNEADTRAKYQAELNAEAVALAEKGLVCKRCSDIRDNTPIVKKLSDGKWEAYDRQSGALIGCITSRQWGSGYMVPGYNYQIDTLAEAAQLLKERSEKTKTRRIGYSQFEKSRAAFKGQVTKLKHRAANGVCPCCTRHFTNLERHMKTKHPEFTQENQP